MELQVAYADRFLAGGGRKTIYFVSSAGSLAALDADTGKPKWVFATEYERKFEAKNLHGYPSSAQTIPDAWDLFISSPAVARGKVYFGSGDGNVYAVDAEAGVLQWKFATKDVVHASPAVAGNTVYIGGWDGALYALDAESGRERWSFQAGQDAGDPQPGRLPVLAGGGGRHRLRRLPRRPRLRARRIHRQEEVGLPDQQVVGDRHAGGARRRRLCGDLRFVPASWRSTRRPAGCGSTSTPRPTSSPPRRLPETGPTSAATTAGSTPSTAKSGQLAWEFQTEASKTDRMKVLNPDGSLNREAFAPIFGDFEDMYIDFYRYISIGAIISSPAVVDGVVYVGSMDGNLYALE